MSSIPPWRTPASRMTCGSAILKRAIARAQNARTDSRWRLSMRVRRPLACLLREEERGQQILLLQTFGLCDAPPA
jgi:hypothetical protein